MKARCCWPPESVRSGAIGAVREPDALDRLVDDRAVAAAQRAEQPAATRAGRRDDLAHGRRRLDPELRALREVAERGAAREARRGLAEEQRLARAGRSRPSASRSSVVLPPPFGPAIATNSPASTARFDVSQHGLPAVVGERDVAQLDR